MHLFDACSKHHRLYSNLSKRRRLNCRLLSTFVQDRSRSYRFLTSIPLFLRPGPDSNRFSSRKRGWNLGVGRNGSKEEGRDFYRRRAEQFALLHAGPIPAEIKSREIVKSLAALTQRVTG